MKLYSGLYSTELFWSNAVKHLAQMISSTAVGLLLCLQFLPMRFAQNSSS